MLHKNIIRFYFFIHNLIDKQYANDGNLKKRVEKKNRLN